MSTETPATPLEESCRCHACGVRYRVDINVPDALWTRIGMPGPGGLLCGRCIAGRIEELGQLGAFALIDLAEVDTIRRGPHMTLDEIVREGRAIWASQPQMTAADQVVVLGKVLLDMSVLARTRRENGAWTEAERSDWARELGNLIATSARFIYEANRDCENAVRAALAGQRRYVERLETR